MEYDEPARSPRYIQDTILKIELRSQIRHADCQIFQHDQPSLKYQANASTSEDVEGDARSSALQRKATARRFHPRFGHLAASAAEVGRLRAVPRKFTAEVQQFKEADNGAWRSFGRSANVNTIVSADGRNSTQQGRYNCRFSSSMVDRLAAEIHDSEYSPVNE
jgi:hypothetical protein